MSSSAAGVALATLAASAAGRRLLAVLRDPSATPRRLAAFRAGARLSGLSG